MADTVRPASLRKVKSGMTKSTPKCSGPGNITQRRRACSSPRWRMPSCSSRTHQHHRAGRPRAPTGGGVLPSQTPGPPTGTGIFVTGRTDVISDLARMRSGDSYASGWDRPRRRANKPPQYSTGLDPGRSQNFCQLSKFREVQLFWSTLWIDPRPSEDLLSRESADPGGEGAEGVEDGLATLGERVLTSRSKSEGSPTWTGAERKRRWTTADRTRGTGRNAPGGRLSRRRDSACIRVTTAKGPQSEDAGAAVTRAATSRCSISAAS